MKSPQRDMQRDAHRARFHVDDPLGIGKRIRLDREASHHLLTVMRARAGDIVELFNGFNGDGYNYLARVDGDGQRPREASLAIIDRQASNTESPLEVELVQAISRGDRMERCLRQATELGVSAIRPLHSSLSVKPLDPQRAHRKVRHWQNIVTSASEQSGRTRVPIIHDPLPFEHWLQTLHEGLSPAGAGLMLVPGASLSLSQWASTMTKSLRLTVLIGPESGFSPTEIAQASGAGITCVSLGPRILRTESAAPAVLATLQAMIGDLAP